MPPGCQRLSLYAAADNHVAVSMRTCNITPNMSVHFKTPLFLTQRTIRKHGRCNPGCIFIAVCWFHSIWRAKQSEESASQHHEGQSWGLWTDARLHEHILKEFNKKLQGLCLYAVVSAFFGWCKGQKKKQDLWT